MKLKCLNCLHFWNRKVKTEQEKVLLSLAAATFKTPIKDCSDAKKAAVVKFWRVN